MPVFKKVSGAAVYLRGIDERVSVGETVDVGEEFNTYLEGRSDFREADSQPAGEQGAPDVEGWADWNEDDWLELDYQQRAEDVQEGRVDEHLEAIADVETSNTVEDAVDERLAEIED